jgi:hypothetical protein
MKRVTILRSIPHASVDVVLACDTPDRLLVGVAMVRGEPGSFAFVHIDRVTALELDRGLVDLFTVLAERAQGPHFVATSDAIPDSL